MGRKRVLLRRTKLPGRGASSPTLDEMAFTSFSYLDLNFVHTVPEVTARIPPRLRRLNAPGAIGCARENHIGSRFDWMPIVMPQTPGIHRVIRS